MALPKRWEPYSRIGTRIEGTRFISFKVPLNKNLCNKLSEDLRFSPSRLVEEIGEQGERLAMVIDLTNTNRYYDKKEIETHGIQYEKIYTEGHKIPRHGVVKKFYAAVDRILEETNDEDSLIGVHCTHGVNRTGYLICRYMVEKMSIEPEKAIAAFTKARGHPIERENYLRDLRLRKDGGPGLKEECGAERRDSNGYSQSLRDRQLRPHRTWQYDTCEPYWQDDYYCPNDSYEDQSYWNRWDRGPYHMPPHRDRQFYSGRSGHLTRAHPYSLDRRTHREQSHDSNKDEEYYSGRSGHLTRGHPYSLDRRTRTDQSHYSNKDDRYADDDYSYHYFDESSSNHFGYQSFQ